MEEIQQDYYKTGSHYFKNDDSVPQKEDEGFEDFAAKQRKHIEPWLSAVFQAEHLNLLVGSGFTSAISVAAGSSATGMQKVTFQNEFKDKINEHATKTAMNANRGEANVED